MPGASGPPVSRQMRPRSFSASFGSARLSVLTSSSASRKLRPRRPSASVELALIHLDVHRVAFRHHFGQWRGLAVRLSTRPIITGVGSEPAR